MKALLVLTSLAMLAATADANAHVAKGCKKNACKTHVVQPFKKTFLGPVGACESGGTFSLKTGLRATDPSGTYLGRYQFNREGWAGAGGTGDPRDASWLEQAYRAVLWLHINGRQSWPNC